MAEQRIETTIEIDAPGLVVAEAALATAAPMQSASAPIPDGCTRRVRVVYAAAYQTPSGDCATASAIK